MKHPSLDGPMFSPNTGRAILGIAPHVLAGEIAAARGAYGTAIAALERAVRLEDALVYTERASSCFRPRLSLGAILLQAGRPDEAETVYWEDPEAQSRVGLVAVRPAPGARRAEEDRPGGDREGAARQGVGARRREADRVPLRPDDPCKGSSGLELARIPGGSTWAARPLWPEGSGIDTVGRPVPPLADPGSLLHGSLRVRRHGGDRRLAVDCRGATRSTGAPERRHRWHPGQRHQLAHRREP
jgi:hypothetical protein